MADVRVAYYGDDVTGSVDVLLQFARRGARGRLFVGTPDAVSLATAASGNDVVGIAGISRSLATAEVDAEVRPALEVLQALHPHIVQYKACSTADSSPAIGSIGRVIEIGRAMFGDRAVPLLFAQPDFGRYTAFGHHFAAEAGVVHRLDRQPTMATHPSTPMRESDLARHLSRQTTLTIGALPFTAYSSAPEIATALRDTSDAAVVLDALDDAHLAMLGQAVCLLAEDSQPVFAIGSGGLSRALALTVREQRPVTIGDPPTAAYASTPRADAPLGPTLVVSGSRSPQTRRQVDAAARAGWHVRPLPVDHDGADAASTEIIDVLASGRSVALTSDDATTSGGDVLTRIARAAASVVLAAVRAHATRRVVVCGGDTSGRVVRLLGVASLSIVANPVANVVLLRAHSAEESVDRLELVLKGGQVGADDMFESIRAHGQSPQHESRS